MKTVLIIGAAGILGREITMQLETLSDVTQICFDLASIPYQRENGVNVNGDACNMTQLSEVVQSADIIVCSLNGDWLKQARTIVQAIPIEKSPRIIWVTGMGIHNEVPGMLGMMWRRYAAIYPAYIKAADVIAESGKPYVLIRTADLTDGSESKYHLYQEGDKVKQKYVSRKAVAHLIIDIITEQVEISEQESIGITN